MATSVRVGTKASHPQVTVYMPYISSILGSPNGEQQSAALMEALEIGRRR
jgi:hypothetical protein